MTGMEHTCKATDRLVDSVRPSPEIRPTGEPSMPGMVPALVCKICRCNADKASSVWASYTEMPFVGLQPVGNFCWPCRRTGVVSLSCWSLPELEHRNNIPASVAADHDHRAFIIC